MSPSRRILLALVVGACAALSLGGTAAAAEFQVAGPAALNGNDVTCAPCRTIQAAVTRAARAPGRDAVVLAAGTYSESVTILDEDDVQIGGRGAATAINGRITVGLPARGRGGNALSYNGIARRVWLVALGVRSPDVAITAQNVDVELHNTSIQGAIRMTNATLGGERNAIATTGCGPTISFTGTVLFTPHSRSGFVSRDVEEYDSFGRRRVIPTRTYLERKGFILRPKFIFIDGRSGATIYSESYREEVLYNAQQTTPALSSYFELMDRLVPNFLSTLSSQKIRGTRVLLK